MRYLLRSDVPSLDRTSDSKCRRLEVLENLQAHPVWQDEAPSSLMLHLDWMMLTSLLSGMKCATSCVEVCFTGTAVQY